MGSLKGQCATSYRSLIETIALDCLVFEKIAFFLHFGARQTDRQTNILTDRQRDKQMDSSDTLCRSRYRERRPNSRKLGLHQSRTAYTVTKSK